MNEQIFSGPSTIILIGIFIANLFIFMFLNWFAFKNELKSYTLFDISILTALGIALCARIAAVIGSFAYYLENGFRLGPITDAGETWGNIFNYVPWRFIDISDNKFLFSGAVLGLIITLNLIFRSSNQLKSLRFLTDRIVISLSVLIIINTGVIWGLAYKEILSADYFQLGTLAAISILTLLLSRVTIIASKRGMLSALFFLLTVVAIVGLNIYRSNEGISNGIEFESIMSLGILMYAIIQLIAVFPKKEGDDEDRAQSRKTEFDNASPLKYKQSYAKRK